MGPAPVRVLLLADDLYSILTSRANDSSIEHDEDFPHASDILYSNHNPPQQGDIPSHESEDLAAWHVAPAVRIQRSIVDEVVIPFRQDKLPAS